MELLSQEIIDRFKQKIPELNKFVDHQLYGMTHLDIICEDSKTIKQYVLAFERLTVIEPTEIIKRIYADVYVRIHDRVLYQIAIKDISIDDAISKKMFRIRGDREIWNLQLKALKTILPNEEFTKPNSKEDEPKEDEIDSSDDDSDNEEWNRKTDINTIPPQLKFIAVALIELCKKI